MNAAPATPALTRALEDAAALVAALGGGLALVRVEDTTPAAEAFDGLAPGEPDAARVLARQVLDTGAPAAADGLVCDAAVALPGAKGLIAALHRAAEPPRFGSEAATLGAHLERIARGLCAQREVATGSDRLDQLARQVPGALYQYQVFPDGRMCFPYASDGLRQVYRVAPEDVRDDASKVVGIGHPDDVERVLASIAVSARTLAPWDCEYRVRFEDGTVQWLHGRATPERLDDGSTLWHGFIMPIDARKAAEQALARSEERFRHFFEAGLVGMTIAEPGGRWVAINRRMGEMLGYTPDEIAQLHWSAFTHPDDVAADQAQYERMAAGEIDGYVMDKRYLRKDGTVLECALAVRCERDATGAMQRVFAIVEDIDDRRRAERALQAERDRLEEQVALRTRELVVERDRAERASRAKTEFLASMSHELRTPLNAILGFAQLLELDPSLGPRSLGHLREVLRAGRHLLGLINEVLDLAQVESGRLAIAAEPLSLAARVDGALALSAPLAASREIRLQAAVPGDLVVLADRVRLDQVLLNLLSNAIKYNRHGGSVRLTARAVDGERVRLEVRDTGAGIAPAKRDQLFQPFSRLGAEFGAVEGAGIGLVLSRRLLDLMDGAIGVDSEPGIGSTFWIELPRGRPVEASASASTGAVQTGAALPEDAAVAVAATVLCIEDNPANLALVEEIVARHPVRLIGAGTGRRGLELARAHRPELVLLDLHLPDMDGFEVLAQLRDDELTRGIPAVALTARALPADERRAVDAGFQDFVTKPIDIPAFDAMLRRWLADRLP